MDIFIVDGARTPFLKFTGKQNKFSASELAVQAGKVLLARQDFAQELIDECIIGCAMPSAYEANIGRIISMRLGCRVEAPAWTVMRNCASGLQAIDSAYQSIMLQRSNIVLAGGTEAMSRAPIVLNSAMSDWLLDLSRARSMGAKVRHMLKLRPKMLNFIIGLKCGLTDYLIDMNMGETAEEVVYRMQITREQMDEFAATSHHRLAQALEENNLAELIDLYGLDGTIYDHDTGMRKDSSVEKLAKLKPTFAKKFGKVTAGNSSQITDGAALLVLAGEKMVTEHNLPVLAKVRDIAWAGLDPKVMGLGPVFATAKLLQQNNLSLNDIDYWEINEAFAGQVLGCVKAFNDEDFCRKHLDCGALGQIDMSKLNIDGGAIALGHPVGASGARIALHLAHVLQRKSAKLGVATLCIGGGQGGAILMERV